MTNTSTPFPRTAEEIRNRITNPPADDLFGFGAEVLAPALSFEDAKPIINPDTSAEDWGDFDLYLDVESATAAAIEYLNTYGWNKASNQRGISAGRSIIKLQTWCWLIGRDDVAEAMEQADYAHYGVPQLKVFADAFDQQMPDDPNLVLMLNGELPSEDC